MEQFQATTLDTLPFKRGPHAPFLHHSSNLTSLSLVLFIHSLRFSSSLYKISGAVFFFVDFSFNLQFISLSLCYYLLLLLYMWTVKRSCFVSPIDLTVCDSRWECGDSGDDWDNSAYSLWFRFQLCGLLCSIYKKCLIGTTKKWVNFFQLLFFFFCCCLFWSFYLQICSNSVMEIYLFIYFGINFQFSS